MQTLEYLNIKPVTVPYARYVEGRADGFNRPRNVVDEKVWPDPEPDSIEGQILAVLRAHPDGLTSLELEKFSTQKRCNLLSSLRRMVIKGLILNPVKRMGAWRANVHRS